MVLGGFFTIAYSLLANSQRQGGIPPQTVDPDKQWFLTLAVCLM